MLERAAGAPLGDVLGALIFGPCGMTSTRYPAGHDGQTADGYDTRWAGPGRLTSTHFKKEADGAKWMPMACTAK